MIKLDDALCEGISCENYVECSQGASGFSKSFDPTIIVNRDYEVIWVDHKKEKSEENKNDNTN
jgi:hypothetical protein